MTEYVVIKGKAYPIANTTKKAKVSQNDNKSLDANVKKTLDWFKSKGHKPIGSIAKASYTTKKGNTISIKRITVKLSSGITKQYNVSKHRTWAVN